LTEIGKELIPFIDYLRQWADKQLEKEYGIKPYL